LRQLGRLTEAGAQLQLALAAEERGAAEEAHVLQETENALARVAQFVMAGQPALALDSLLPVQDHPAGTCVAAPEVTAALASIRLRLGDLDGAARGYTKAAQQAEDQPPHATSRTPAEWKREAEIVQEGVTLKAQGNERFKAKDFQGAVAAYEQAIALLPMVAPLHTNLAAALAQAEGGTRQFDAVCACEAALAIDQSSLKARVRRATCLSSLGRHDEALDEMGTAMEMAPGNKEVMEKMQLLELAAGIAAEDEDDAMRRYGGGGAGYDDGAVNHAAGGGGGDGGGGRKKKKKKKKK
jgi:tetratricopeptide (TPR) repeat protein